jgi:hypothetical protein
MIRCDCCEQLLDSDFIEFEIYGKDDEELCINCYNEKRGDEEPDYEQEPYFEKQQREY